MKAGIVMVLTGLFFLSLIFCFLSYLESSEKINKLVDCYDGRGSKIITSNRNTLICYKEVFAENWKNSPFLSVTIFPAILSVILIFLGISDLMESKKK